MRSAEVQRNTLETRIRVKLDLDGSRGAGECQTIERIGVEAILDAGECFDQLCISDCVTDAQAGQRT